MAKEKRKRAAARLAGASPWQARRARPIKPAKTSARADAAPLGGPKGLVAPDKYFNRELSWLEFNARVLHEAQDERTPLLERVGFLSIFTSNLDEFFMKRVGLLNRQVEAGVVSRKPDGLTPRQQVTAIRRQVQALAARQAQVYIEQILPALAARGIHIRAYGDLSADERQQAQKHFRAKVFPVLTPLAVDPGHPFPFLSNLSTSLGVTLRHPDKDGKLFARIKVPTVLPQFIRLDAAANHGYRVGVPFLTLLELIRHNLEDLFPGMVVLGVMPFRITRNADVESDVDDADGADLLDLVEEALRQRKFERVVRLEVPPRPDPWMLDFLMQELELSDTDVYEAPGLLDYTTLKPIAELPIREIRYEPWSGPTCKELADAQGDIFSVIRAGDLLIHHPYESFTTSIERFVRQAAEDPNVLAIKITLYRTGHDSPFIPALIRAAEAGKQVVALVELKARFDEASNIELGQALEKAGVHVVYGLVGLKTHTKITLIVRQEPDGLKCYSHIGTGNYHVQTAKLYTDVSLLTCRDDLGEDLVDLFHYLTGRSLKRAYRKLLVAPVNMLERFLGMIEREAANQQAGRPARIVAKMNSLESSEIIEALYRASAAGVHIDLLVRGFCCLRPGVPGLSENIRVSSILGRFLEHSRIFHFANGQDDPLAGEFYIGSADWMYRNLQARVEVITPIEDAAARGRLWEILQVCLRDQRQAWDLRPDGTYVQRTPPEGTGSNSAPFAELVPVPGVPLASPEAAGTQETLMQLTRQRLQLGAEARQPATGSGPPEEAKMGRRGAEDTEKSQA